MLVEASVKKENKIVTGQINNLQDLHEIRKPLLST